MSSRKGGNKNPMALSTRKEELLGLIYPAACLGCGAQGRVVCERCLAGLAARAPVTGNTPRQPGRVPVFSGLRAACQYGGLARDMVLRLKSSGRPFAHPLSRLMLAAGGNEPSYLVPDLVCFVPSEKRKIAQRGYNPAELLAREIARCIGRPLVECLSKSRHTQDQDQVRGDERWANIAGAFAARPGGAVVGRVLLVDDVLTTGATADACAGVLIEAGACSVHVLVAARAVLRNVGLPGGMSAK